MTSHPPPPHPPHLSLLPQHLPEQDETVPVGEVAPAPAPGDLPLAELDHVVLVGHAGLQGAGEGC